MFPTISEKMFLNNVDTGDILLFRTANYMVGSWITRTFTKSHFDHVAILMRFGSTIDDLYVLEAVGEYGVRLVSWHQVRYYLGSFFNQISYRKLFHSMDTDSLK
jgi:hypothetical protein